MDGLCSNLKHSPTCLLYLHILLRKGLFLSYLCGFWYEIFSIGYSLLPNSLPIQVPPLTQASGGDSSLSFSIHSNPK